MTVDNKDIVITSAVRTAIGTFRGSLKDMQARSWSFSDPNSYAKIEFKSK